MIQSYAHLEHWRRLLEEEIPREMAYYMARVNAGTATDAWHQQAVQQCAAWTTRLNAMLANADLALFQARCAIWTTAAIQAVLTSLAAIEAAVQSYLAASAPGAALVTTGTSPLAALQSALAEQVQA